MKGSNRVRYLIPPEVQWFLGTSLLIRCLNLIYPSVIISSEYHGKTLSSSNSSN